MVECHPEPEKSVSDARQAISLPDMIDIIRSIEPIAHAVGRTVSSPHLVPSKPATVCQVKSVKRTSAHESLLGELRAIRREVDKIDATVAALLEKRLTLALEVGALKEELDLPSRDHVREREVIELVSRCCSDPQIADKVRDIYERIMEASLQLQNEAPVNEKVA